LIHNNTFKNFKLPHVSDHTGPTSGIALIVGVGV